MSYVKPVRFERDGKEWEAQINASIKNMTDKLQTPIVVRDVIELGDDEYEIHIGMRPEIGWSEPVFKVKDIT